MTKYLILILSIFIFISSPARAQMIANPGGAGMNPQPVSPSSGYMRACELSSPLSTTPEAMSGVLVNGKIIMSEAEYGLYAQRQCIQQMRARPEPRLTNFCGVILYGTTKANPPHTTNARNLLLALHRTGEFAEYVWRPNTFRSIPGRTLFGWNQIDGFKPIIFTTTNMEC